ncbi:MAG: DUF1640 domain-containing protein [Magnetococcales bacterium]|nr:DUF1640 domain-containing protein [Magnetococcales bacterium]
MATLTFDTYAYIKKLREAGVSEAQAEAHADALKAVQEASASELVTKRDLAEAKVEIIQWVIGASGVVIALIKLLPGGH